MLDSTTTVPAAAGAVERALRLLRYIADGGHCHNLSEVGRHLGVNRITLMRLLDGLQASGMIVADVETGYRLGLPFLSLAAAALGSSDLLARARQALPALVVATRLTAYLVLPEGADIVYVLAETPDAPLVSRISIGSRLPAYRATPGLAMWAALPPAALEAALALQAAAPPRESLAPRLEEIRQSGCAWSHSGLEAGIDACAAAVGNRRGEVVAAISVAGPHSYFVERPELEQIAEVAVKKVAAQLSSSLP